MSGITPSQTVGPFFHDSLLTEDQSHLVDQNHQDAIRLRGKVYDGAGEPVPDAMVEIWQADAEGRYPEAERSSGGFIGFGRSGTDPDGYFEFVTIKPGRVPGPQGKERTESEEQAPHLLVSVFARGLLRQLVTRIYFPDEEEMNAADPVLSAVAQDRRPTLIAEPEEGGLRFDVRLQDGPGGEPETVFFDV